MKTFWVVSILGLAWSGVALADDTAEDVYRAKCKGCHGEDGKAHTKIGVKEKIPDMTTAEWQAHTPDSEIKEVITEGSPKKGSKMKAFKDKLTPGEIDSLVGYLRQLKGK
jgi:mono/diheme cytochrome c family protein